MNSSIARGAAAAFIVAVGITFAQLAYGGSPTHYFGGIPDLTEPAGPGVRLNEVRLGSPAEQAGLQEGDVVVQLGEVPIETIENFVTALRTALPGVPILVIYYREGMPFETKAVLVARR